MPWCITGSGPSPSGHPAPDLPCLRWPRESRNGQQRGTPEGDSSHRLSVGWGRCRSPGFSPANPLGSRRERRGPRATRPLRHLVCGRRCDPGRPQAGGHGRWQEAGESRMPCRGLPEASEGASESEPRKAGDPRPRTEGAGPSPGAGRRTTVRGAPRTQRPRPRCPRCLARGGWGKGITHRCTSVQAAARETAAPDSTWRRTSGAAPEAVQAARPVLNGGREATCRQGTRLAPTHRRGGGDQTGYVCLNRPTSRSLRHGLRFQESARRAFCAPTLQP